LSSPESSLVVFLRFHFELDTSHFKLSSKWLYPQYPGLPSNGRSEKDSMFETVIV